MLKKINLYTDGSCLGNPGPGGYAAILIYQKHERILSQGFFLTTNNRMELLAAIKGLEALKTRCDVTLYSDSQYLRNGILSWIHNWKKNGWKTAQKKPVKNADLWIMLDNVVQKHQIEWVWVKGHAGHPENERCDEIAKQAASSPTLNDEGFQENNNEPKNQTLL